MKCHYEVLDVPRDVNNEDLKKAYRKAALKWHPDKNLDNPEHAKEQFQLVQQAYEILSDPHERSWYDSHRDAFLKGGLGGDYKDDSLDVFPYFTTTCFKGYGDGEGGFYSVYREVFNKIAAEDADFMDDGDSDFEIPDFGTSTSDFKEVVQPFYAYWQDYTTKKSYSWLDQYDIKDLPNRRVAKLVEKENKKIREKARKERNEQIRNLVAFVRKRDKRVHAQAEVVKQQQAEKAKIAEEKRKSKVRQRQQELQDVQETEWAKFSNFEDELKNIEKSILAEHGEIDSSNEEDEDEEEELDSLYCPACQKLFKSDKAFANHVNSKKHKENVEKMRQMMLEEEEEEEEEESGDEDDEEEQNEDLDEIVSDDLDEQVSETENNEAEYSAEEGDVNDDKLERNEELDSELQEITKISGLEKESQKPEGKENKKQGISSPFTSKQRDDEVDSEVDELSLLSKKQRRRLHRQRMPDAKGDNEEKQEDHVETESKSTLEKVDDEDKQTEAPKTKLKGKKAKDARKQKRLAEASSVSNGQVHSEKSQGSAPPKTANRKKIELDTSEVDTEHTCVTCASNFSSKNKLFEHLKKTGHSVYLPSRKEQQVEDKKKGKGKKK